MSWSGLEDSIYDFNRSIDNYSSSYLNEITFINKLTTAGTLWKWAEDPDETIYITKGGSGKHKVMFNTAYESFWQLPSTTNLFNLTQHYGTFGWNKRNRWTINAETLFGGNAMGSGPSGYLPTNDPGQDAHFANDGSLLTSSTTPAKPTGGQLPAPGIRQDGMGVGLTALNSGVPYTIPNINKKITDASGNNVGLPVDTYPGSVTWVIIEASELTTLKHSSHNPAIFETEPKENLDLEIYHEVGQVYPLEYNSKTNELYTPIGTVVKCWRPTTATYDIGWAGNPQIVNSNWWDRLNGGYGGNSPIPTGNIDIGGRGSINPSTGSPWWTPPIILSQVGHNTITLVDDVGVGFDNSTGWPNEHILPGDHLVFQRPDGSSTSAVVIGATTQGGNIYAIEQDLSNRTMVLPWFNCYSFGNGVESNRIRDDYNQVIIDKGPKVSSILSEVYEEERKFNGLIYSGIYNSTSGVNNLNQFIAAEKITKDLNPTFGSIQKLFQKRINLIAFCEDKVVKILSNKDALYNSDGSTNLTATNRVLGDAQPYVGEYGISRNPESFASENYRAYFADKQRGAVMRLSRDGLTAISDHGMLDWFRDNLSLVESGGKILGGFDIEKREYNITLVDISKTLSFREDVRGWVSFKSFIPEDSISLAGKYYTFNSGNIYRHHATTDFQNNLINFNTYYGIHAPSHVTTILNTDPKSVKNFQTLNYEGTQSRVDQLIEYTNPNDNILYTDRDYHNLEPNKVGWYVENIHTDMQDGSLREFIEKEGKWFNYIYGNEPSISIKGQIQAGFEYDPNEFSWQGIGLSNPRFQNQVGGCLDPSANNYGCATILHPNSLVPCPQDLPWVDFDDGTCDYSGLILGCLADVNAPNYNCETALYSTPPTSPCNDGVQVDDGSCVTVVGCVDGSMFNYNPAATADCNGDPLTYINGVGYSIQNPGWNSEPCCEPIVYGCLDDQHFNYAPTANTACQGPVPTTPASGCFPPQCWGPYTSGIDCCEEAIYGCTDSTALNYNPLANVNAVSSTDPSDPCITIVNGCTDDTVGMNPDIFGRCTGVTPPCNSPLCCGDGLGYHPSNYNPLANVDDGSCTGPGGCTDPTANNFDENAYVDDGSCYYGCCDTTFDQGIWDGVQSLVWTLGAGSTCPGYGTVTLLSVAAVVTITRPDGSFYVDTSGVTWNLNNVPIPLTTTPVTGGISAGALAGQTGSWTIDVQYVFITTGTGGAYPPCTTTLTQSIVAGCMDQYATNYDPTATVDDGSCVYAVAGCTDGGPGVGLGNPFVWPSYGAADNFDVSATVDDGSCIYTGCMTPGASNYNGTANYNNPCSGCCVWTGCMNNSIGCHPAATAIQAGISIPGLGTCSAGSIAPNAVWNTSTLDCGTCRDGTTCSGNFCCGVGNGFDKTNFDPTATTACASCCTSTNVSGCGQAQMPFPNQATATLNYNPCVDLNDPASCIPEVYGCTDPGSLNYGSYKPSSAWGAFSSNTNYGTSAPVGNTGNTWDYASNPNLSSIISVNSVAGLQGPNISHQSTCITPVAGCMDDGTLLVSNGDPYNSPNPGTAAWNYNPLAVIDDGSCCYDDGCILPNYYSVTNVATQMNTQTNLSSTGCTNYLANLGGSLQDCYGGVVNVVGVTVAGTASGTNVGNGVQLGNNLQVSLNGGNTCADCLSANATHANPLSYFTNQDGHLDPGNVVPNPLSQQQLTTTWGFINSGTGSGDDCCVYHSGCSNPCARNFNPTASTQLQHQDCDVAHDFCTPLSPAAPPWNATHYCCEPYVAEN